MPKPETTAGTFPAEHGGKREDCAAWPACACASTAMLEARDRVIQSAIKIVYDGMSEAGWTRIRRAVEHMENVERESKKPVDVSA